jgi:hypothetical protein
MSTKARVNSNKFITIPNVDPRQFTAEKFARTKCPALQPDRVAQAYRPEGLDPTPPESQQRAKNEPRLLKRKFSIQEETPERKKPRRKTRGYRLSIALHPFSLPAAKQPQDG